MLTTLPRSIKAISVSPSTVFPVEELRYTLRMSIRLLAAEKLGAITFHDFTIADLSLTCSFQCSSK